MSGGAVRGRTDDLLNAIQALSQLSYGPTRSATSTPARCTVKAEAGTIAVTQAISPRWVCDESSIQLPASENFGASLGALRRPDFLRPSP